MQARAFHFQKFAIPLENANFELQKKLVDMDIESVTAIFEAESDKIDPVTEPGVLKSLGKLKNKVADSMRFVQ